MLTLSRTSRNPVPAGHSTYVHTRVISEQRDRSPKPRYTRSERANFKRENNQTLYRLATAVGAYDLADKVQRCYANVTAITCGKHVAQLIPDYTCEFRLCSNCARRRVSKLVRKYLPAVVAFPAFSSTAPVHLVLTQAHRVESLRDAVNRITGHFKALRRRSVWKEHFRGGMFSVEFTIGKDGLYHAHLHILAFRKRWFDIQLLKDAWLEITGDSTNLRLDPITGEPIKALREVLKYAIKPACIDDLTPDQFRDLLAMKNQRMFGTFGEFQKFYREYEPEPDAITSLFPSVETHAGEPCSSCGNPLFDVRVKASELADFLRRLDASPALE